jgi:hypothetical protein
MIKWYSVSKRFTYHLFDLLQKKNVDCRTATVHRAEFVKRDYARADFIVVNPIYGLLDTKDSKCFMEEFFDILPQNGRNCRGYVFIFLWLLADPHNCIYDCHWNDIFGQYNIKKGRRPFRFVTVINCGAGNYQINLPLWRTKGDYEVIPEAHSGYQREITK